ncbi:hypothetical protein SAMN02745221_00447 [Thermosyntropha lipolytica DSM 11003]|uniref:DUF8042 domain-containing protein n=1 Tax=Thermosyntropha lipolytica DSM 11003 TaxID=1123382 RepID=A0A1M5KPS0_9FIRM|nr:hypothetical protein [Thermosyntropha lipolytica]SHG54183.1 hypothetical protein SAMN02745221_00447 [Thermosyntropha lipolytica DSM 11003]
MLDKTVVQNILELLGTMEEAFAYTRDKLEALEIEATTGVLHDTMEAFLTIENSLLFMSPDLAAGRIKQATDKLRDAFSLIVQNYEEERGYKALEIVRTSLEPAFRYWKQTLEEELRPYVVS